MISQSQKERAQKVIPGGTKKKDSSAKSLNDIKKPILRFRSSMMSEGSQPVAPTLHARQEKIDHRVSAKDDHRVSAQN